MFAEESGLRRVLRTGFAAALALGFAGAGLRAADAEAPTSVPLNLSQAVERSLKNYPAIRVNDEQVNAAMAAIRVARMAYLPRADALAQFNRSTRNNVFGLLLPQSTLPSISGPVIGSNNFGTVWGSAVGVLVTWEPFDFGFRHANVQAADAARAESTAAAKRTQFEVAVSTADAYLTLIASEQTVRAAQSGVDRSTTVAKTIGAQVSAQLRPGADQSRAEAEQAAARTQLAQAEQAVDMARATLGAYLGLEPSQVSTVAEKLVQLPPEQNVSAIPHVEGNPALLQQNAAAAQAQAVLRTLERSYFPKFYLQAAGSARGTGAELDGRRLGGLNGLAPNVQNYALGLTVEFPLLELPALRAREAAQNATIRSEAARTQQVAAELKAQWHRAVAALNGARQVARNTPVQVSSARAASQQSTARYEAGLANIAEVAEAQRLLTQAEIDDALARLGVWRGLLAIAAAAGDIQPFVAEASR